MDTDQPEIVPSSSQKSDWKKYFNYQAIVQNIPFFLFLAVLAVLYIYNGHYADKLIRKIGTTEKNIKEQEYEFKEIKSQVIYRSKASELAKAVAPLGLKELQTPATFLSDSLSKQ